MTYTQKIFQESIPWVRLAICANTHIKSALLNVLHNEMNDPQVTGIPSDPKDLYLFLQTKQRKIRNDKHIKKGQKSILLPVNGQSVESSLFDISLIRWLIQTFSNIQNDDGKWLEPLPTDQTICANVYRAAEMRNRIFHHNDVSNFDETTFETMWKEMKDVLQGLKYTEDIEPMRKETLDFSKLQGEILQELLGYLDTYKKESSNAPQEFYIQRRFSVDNNRNNIVTEIGEIIKESDQVNIYADAGVGKSVTARNIKYEWHKGEILPNFYLIYFDSKLMNQRIQYHSLAAPLFFSELGDFLRKKGKTEKDFLYFDCVKTTIDDLIILIDGIDEFPIKDLVTNDYVNELEKKVINNDKISAVETITAIYFGFLFPYSKVCLFGRRGEFERQKSVKANHLTSIFNKVNRKVKDLELLTFSDANVKDFTCKKICYQQQNGQRTCISACHEMYAKIKNIELCKIPTDLNSLIELYKKHPNKNIGKITQTKLIIATVHNRLHEHINLKNNFTFKTFREISEQKDFSKYLECVRTLGEISFKTLLEGHVTVQVEEEQEYFKYKEEIKIERKILEELDFFYIRDFVYYYILEPHHTLNIEFLSACYLFSHPDEWDSILKLNKDRQLVIISFVAGLYADNYFTKDFTVNVLKVSLNYSIEQFFSWLYEVEDVRNSLPDGGDGYKCWYGLMENQKLSPSFFLLDFISHEVEIPQTYIPKTIVCYCGGRISSFEWHNMEYSKHNFLTKVSDELKIESFLIKLSRFKFIIKGNIWINNSYEFDLLDKYGSNNLINFQVNVLKIDTSLDRSFCSYFRFNELYIGEECSSSTIDMILSTLSTLPEDNSSSNIPIIQCKRLYISDIQRFNDQQTEKLFTVGLSGVVDFIQLGCSTFFTDKQITILKDVESRNTSRILNIKFNDVQLNSLFDLSNLGKRHLSLIKVKNLTDNEVIEFRKLIQIGYSNNFPNYKVINPYVPFVRKKHHSLDCEQSMYFNLYCVDFTKVSPHVFANTFSLIPSLECWDNDSFDYIPSSHWLNLSQKEDCQINEMRIWFPKLKNVEHFLNIKTDKIQLICCKKDDLQQLLNHIMNNLNVQLNKEMKVFVVKYDENDWNYYEEITLYGGDSIKEYKNNHTLDELLLDNICVPFYEGEKHLHLKSWICEISLPLQADMNSVTTFSDDNYSMTSYC